VDLGGAYIGTTQDRVLSLLQRFGLSLFDVFHGGKAVAVDGPASAPLLYEGLIPPYGPATLVDLNALLLDMEELAATVDVERPWLTPDAARLDAQSVGQWVEARGWTERSKRAARGAIQSLTCSSPDAVSLLWWLWMVRSCANLKMLMAVTDGGQEKKVVEGLAELSARIAAHLGCVRLQHVVREIDWSAKGRIRVTVELPSGERRDLICAQLIVAVPPALYNSIVWRPALPPQKSQLGQWMPMGSIIKTVLYYDKPYWKLLGLSGESFDSSGAPVVYSVDDSKPDGSHPAIMGFVSAHAARELQLKTPEQRRDAVAAHYARIHGFSEKPIRYVEQNWSAEPFSGGCYMGVCGPGALTSFCPALRTPLADDTIHFAGTETAVRWTGYADGAIESGYRCAAAVRREAWDWRDRPAPTLMTNAPLGFTAAERHLPRLGTLIGVSAGTVAAVALWLLRAKL
jgi:monoamine oxidase